MRKATPTKQVGYRLDAEKLQANYERFYQVIDSFVERGPALKALYDSFGERLVYEPASSFEHYHNAIPGGYIDHVLRVLDFSIKTYELWNSMGLDTLNFTMDELRFAAFNHDLGKLGFSGENNGQYIPNSSDWHRKTLGRVYEINSNIPFINVNDRTNYMLQVAGVPVSLNEFLGMKLTDGLYDDNNKPYLLANRSDSRLRINLPIILHHADMMASRYEFECWNKQGGNIPSNMSYNSLSDNLSDGYREPVKKVVTATEEKVSEDFNKLFNDLFV